MSDGRAIALRVVSAERPLRAVGEFARDGAANLAAASIGPRDIRFVRTLRVSVTDHCNLRCVYCMPEDGVEWLPREDLLSYEEITEVARVAIDLGVLDFKITGGEPLVRQDVPDLVRMLRQLPGIGEISLTTNGMLLERFAAPLAEAGINRVTVSLDTLNADRFRQITRTGDLDRVWRGIEAAERHGLGPVKLNCVVLRGQNFDEVADFAALTVDSARTVRFIEFMPLGQSRTLLDGAAEFVAWGEMRERIEQAYGPLSPADADVGSGPARVFRIDGAKGRIGFIHAMSAPFCSTCNRMRLTPDGELRACLFDGGEVDLKPMLRPFAQPKALQSAFVKSVTFKPDAHQSYGNRQMSRIGG
ncbi:MAG: GTP 3',8-cyclase MoaA [Phycisphaerales bacterium]|nr:GTP 3',8-cyclase MoaA [Phycisphaerales bacterium]